MTPKEILEQLSSDALVNLRELENGFSFDINDFDRELAKIGCASIRPYGGDEVVEISDLGIEVLKEDGE